MWRVISILTLVAALTGCGDVAPPARPPKAPATPPPQPTATPSAQTTTNQTKTPAAAHESIRPYEQYTPPPLQQKIEQQVLKLLSDGDQAAAEEVLANHVKTLPEHERMEKLIMTGGQQEAITLVKQHAEIYRANQRLLYWHAACLRSRFDVLGAIPRFVLAGIANERTVLGQSTFRILGLDAGLQIRQKPDEYFAAFEDIVNSHPDEIALRWMLAVECRSHDRNEQGVVHYRKILERWNPGPVLVHQTYANLLDKLKRYEEALVERRKAVELEPAGWSYDGLGNTLDHMKRYDEADKAHAKAMELDPGNGHHLGNWAANAMYRKQYDVAIQRCEYATQLDPDYGYTWQTWGQCLEAQGKKHEALIKYRKALAIYPDDDEIKQLVAALEKNLKQEPKKGR